MPAMSTPSDDPPADPDSDTASDPWQRLADHSDVLEMCVEEDVPFAEHAQQLLDQLEQEGYR